MDNVEGAWVGRLVDVGGFEGSVSLTLNKGKASLEGAFEAAIDGQHRPTCIRGRVSGKQSKGRIVLKLALGQEDSPVTISLDGHLIKTRSGERAVCGSYEVSARRASPLKAGVISMRQPSPEAQTREGLLVRSVTASVGGAPQGAAPDGPVTKPSRGKKGTASNRTRRKS